MGFRKEFFLEALADAKKISTWKKQDSFHGPEQEGRWTSDTNAVLPVLEKWQGK